MAKVTKADVKKIKGLATNDYQRRNGNYPDSDIPDYIRVFEVGSDIEVVFTFKNTDERTAGKVAAEILNRKVGKTIHSGKNRSKEAGAILITSQVGDYHDDWVEASFQVTRWGK